MKLKATKRELRNGYSSIISIGYCDAQYLLRYSEPFSFCKRAEGWACDNYDVNGVLISTGYAPINSLNTKHNYQTIREYEDKARAIATNYNMTYDEQRNAVNDLLIRFVQASY